MKEERRGLERLPRRENREAGLQGPQPSVWRFCFALRGLSANQISILVTLELGNRVRRLMLSGQSKV